MVPGSHFSIRFDLYLVRQGIRTPLLYIVSDGDLILPSYLTNRWAVRNGDPDILVVAAIEATTQLLAKGSSLERKKLLDADVFPVALKLYDRRSQREQSLKLLHAIVLHLSHEILNDGNLAIQMISLFEWVNCFFLLISHWATFPVTLTFTGTSPLRFIKRGQVIQKSTRALLYPNY